ncbi:MAG: alpha/beta hydrolase [Pseudomonadales bacterium]|nr:alpha/beta hydrolase [Pseudomonadales bacterium]
MKLFQAAMALFSRLFPRRASRLALSLLTTPRIGTLSREAEYPEPDYRQPVGARARLDIWSGGPVRVLLVHGWSGHVSQFVPLMEQFDRQRYTLYVLQLPGHGDTPDGPSHVGDFIAAIREAMALIGHPLDLAIGHSMGAGALAFVMSEPVNIRSGVLIAAPAEFRSLVGRLADFLHFGQRARQRLLDGMAARVGMGFDELDIARRGRDIRVPVLVVHDTRDREIPFADGLRLHRAIPAAELFQTAGVGHRRVLSDKAVLDRILVFAGEAGGEVKVPA